MSEESGSTPDSVRATHTTEREDADTAQSGATDTAESGATDDHTRLGGVLGLGDSDGFDLPDLGPDPPSVSIPDPSEVDVPREVERAFWSLVLTVNLAVLGVCLGAMFVGFRGEWRLGGTLLAVGLALFVRAGRRYRRYADRPTPLSEN